MINRPLLFGIFVFTLFLGILLGAGYLGWEEYWTERDRERRIEALVQQVEKGAESDQGSPPVSSEPRISIYSVPSRAEARLQGKDVGATPINEAPLSSDSVHLVLRKSGYAPLDTTLVPDDTGYAFYLFSLQPVEPGSSDTSSAIADMGSSTPGAGSVPGSQESDLADTSESYPSEDTLQSRSTDESLAASGDRGGEMPEESGPAVQAAPEPAAGSSGQATAAERREATLQVLVKPWGSIYVDGELREMDTDVMYTVRETVGVHRLKVEHPVLGTLRRSVRVAPDTTFVTMDFRNAARLVVTSQPTPGEIYLDGQATGFETPSRISLDPGRHTVEVRQSGRTAVGGPREVVIDAGEVDSLSFTLEQELSP